MQWNRPALCLAVAAFIVASAATTTTARTSTLPATEASTRAALGTGYVVKAYHNRDEFESPIIFGRQFICSLADGSRQDAIDCAMEWCQLYSRGANNHPHTSRCYEGTISQARANRWITESDYTTIRRTAPPRG